MACAGGEAWAFPGVPQNIISLFSEVDCDSNRHYTQANGWCSFGQGTDSGCYVHYLVVCARYRGESDIIAPDMVADGATK